MIAERYGVPITVVRDVVDPTFGFMSVAWDGRIRMDCASPCATHRERLSGRSGAALDPCCALQTTTEIPAGGQASVVFVLGEAGTPDEARSLIRRYRSEDLSGHLRAVTDRWLGILAMACARA